MNWWVFIVFIVFIVLSSELLRTERIVWVDYPNDKARSCFICSPPLRLGRRTQKQRPKARWERGTLIVKGKERGVTGGRGPHVPDISPEGRRAKRRGGKRPSDYELDSSPPRGEERSEEGESAIALFEPPIGDSNTQSYERETWVTYLWCIPIHQRPWVGLLRAYRAILVHKEVFGAPPKRYLFGLSCFRVGNNNRNGKPEEAKLGL